MDYDIMNKTNIRSKIGILCGIFLFNISAAEVVQLSSQKVVDLAKKQSLQIVQSELNVESQQKTVQSTLASFLPVLNGTGSYTHLFETPVSSMFTPNVISAGVSVAQPLFTGGKLINGYKLAKSSSKAQQATHERNLTDIEYTATQMYWGYVVMLKGLESVHEERAWLEDLLSMQDKLYKNEMIIELDLLNTKIQIDNLKLAELKTKGAITNYGDQLLLFLGLPTGQSIEVDTSDLKKELDQFTSPSSEEISRMIEDRQDLRSIKYQIESLGLMKNIQAGSSIPTISGFVSSNYTNQYSMETDDLKRSTSAGLQLTWNIYDWGKTNREIEKTKIQIKQLELTYNNLREQIRLNINSLIRAVDESRKALAIAQEDMAIAKKALDVAKIKYDAQAITNTDLLNNRAVLTNKTVAYTQARVNAILALEEYKVAPMNTASSASASRTSSSSGSR